MAEFLAPGLVIREVSAPRPVQAIGTSTAAFVGVAERGPVDEPVLVTDFAAFAAKFGGFTDDAVGFIANANLAYAVRSFFDNGGGRCYVVRTTKDAVTAQGALPIPVEETSTTAFQFSASSPGSWGNVLTIGIRQARIHVDIPDKRFSLDVKLGGKVVESFEEISLDPRSEAFIVKAVNGVSDRIVVHHVTSAYAIGQSAESGDYLTDGLGSDGSEPDIQGYETSIMGLESKGDMNLLCVPDVHLVSEPDRQEVMRRALSFVDNVRHGDSFAILDSFKGENPSSGSPSTYRHGQASKNAALYLPWLKVEKPGGGSRLIPPCGAVAGIYARTDDNRGVFKAPAGLIDGSVQGVVGLERNVSQGQQEVLNPVGVNVIRNFAGTGPVVWGARTLSTDTQWTYVPVRRLLILVERSLKRAAEDFVFEPHTPNLWASVSRSFKTFLRTLWDEGAFVGAEADAFFVKVDEENNPPSSRALGRLVIDVGVAPVKPAEFILVRITQQLAEG